MENTRLPDVSPSLSIKKAIIEIVFSESHGSLLSLVSPPLSDIMEMVDLHADSFSLKDSVKQAGNHEKAASDRLVALEQKSERFAGSATYLNRIANLKLLINAEGGGRRERQAAVDASPDEPIFLRKLAELEFSEGSDGVALELFRRNAERDGISALRAASMSVATGDYLAAEKWVVRAVDRNPAGYAEQLFLGALCLAKASFRSAIASFRIAIEDRPNSSAAHSNLGLAYLGVHRPDKAFKNLRKALVLDPFNTTAIIAYADVGSTLGKHEDVVSALKYYVEFEQKQPTVWGRLARSLMELGRLDDCLHALKRQGAFSPTSGVWNNIGVVYARKKMNSSAVKAFGHALKIESEDGLSQDILIVRNIAVLVAKMGQFDQVLSIAGQVIDQDVGFELAKDKVYSELYSVYLAALLRTNQDDRAVQLADKLLEVRGLSSELTRWIMVMLTATHGLRRDDDQKLMKLVKKYGVQSDESVSSDPRVVNNVAFALAELGCPEESFACLEKVSHLFHRDAYITATLGLINMRMGRVDRGERLYREAVALAVDRKDKDRIRQKMNLELGRSLVALNSAKAKRLLKAAAEEKGGERLLRIRAKNLLEQLPLLLPKI